MSSQLYAAYDRARRIQSLAAIIGEDSLSTGDRQVLNFGRAFEEKFLRQRPDENRSITQTLDLAWQILKELPRGDLTRVTKASLRTMGEG